MSTFAPEAAGRIGPNAALQLVAAVREREGEGTLRALLQRAAAEDRTASPVAGLVPVGEVRALHAALVATVGVARARALADEAGRRTAAYLLARRIPRPLQRLLALLPSRLARPLLLGAIARHAWTFTGGGRFAIEPGPSPTLSIEPCPLCPGTGGEGLGCVYYAATFEVLLRRLVDPRTSVEPAACGATGSRRCVLRIRRISA